MVGAALAPILVNRFLCRDHDVIDRNRKLLVDVGQLNETFAVISGLTSVHAGPITTFSSDLLDNDDNQRQTSNFVSLDPQLSHSGCRVVVVVVVTLRAS